MKHDDQNDKKKKENIKLLHLWGKTPTYWLSSLMEKHHKDHRLGDNICVMHEYRHTQTRSKPKWGKRRRKEEEEEEERREFSPETPQLRQREWKNWWRVFFAIGKGKRRGCPCGWGNLCVWSYFTHTKASEPHSAQRLFTASSSHDHLHSFLANPEHSTSPILPSGEIQGMDLGHIRAKPGPECATVRVLVFYH